MNIQRPRIGVHVRRQVHRGVPQGRFCCEGAFGHVYLGYDPELGGRAVAIKVPRPNRVSRPEDAEAYVAEARMVATLDHPAIVPVFDMGRTEDGGCYVVSKYVEGEDLRQRLASTRLPLDKTVELVATVAGKPAYMSPEQARGEGHLVDGRPDLFSLGAIFYELLTGTVPFRGKTVADVLDRLACLDPRPPRQRDDRIPRELGRICLKALAKRTTDRYDTALDMATDLRDFQTDGGRPKKRVAGRPKVIPKGLRSFDANDSDFFLRLLPGSRDREGYPESIRFWKNKIEETDPDKTFRVGLIDGPSGCGRSSFAGAGLLLRLSSDVTVVHVGASGCETESRLLKGLRKRCIDLPPGSSLTEQLATLRRGRLIPHGKKILIVIDQFEQWLHVNREQEQPELVEALRHCDGGRVQCIVMVRDDFWMAVTRFFRQLEVRLIAGESSAAVELLT